MNADNSDPLLFCEEALLQCTSDEEECFKPGMRSSGSSRALLRLTTSGHLPTLKGESSNSRALSLWRSSESSLSLLGAASPSSLRQSGGTADDLTLLLDEQDAEVTMWGSLEHFVSAAEGPRCAGPGARRGSFHLLCPPACILHPAGSSGSLGGSFELGELIKPDMLERKVRGASLIRGLTQNEASEGSDTSATVIQSSCRTCMAIPESHDRRTSGQGPHTFGCTGALARSCTASPEDLDSGDNIASLSFTN